ncbi:MAG: sugar kinase [Rhodospirillum sp.]|nr:sugar kinase [Rhodospirillum sp.]MCF8490760.1 sugar kinase [Rhodospirillum sp.]MCF8502247.1 sugar kinase [Rhodospirillum sp.]
MNPPTNRVALLGECMLELVHGADGALAMGFGGDTLNTAVYMARLGASVEYVTALGDDPHSDRMVSAWQDEGVGCGLVARVPGRVPGLYMIETDDKGERRFLYWRDQAPARELFTLPTAEGMMARLMDFGMVYLSGISLAIWGEAGRAILLPFLDRFRAEGGLVAFDTNWRPRLWPDIGTARAAYEAMYVRSDILLPGVEDIRALHGDPDEDAVFARVTAHGAREVILKREHPGCLVITEGQTVPVPAVADVTVVDTTAAGDSFAAGYLSRRAALGPVAAAGVASRLAASVIGHRGAIIPRSAMPTLD